ncbi:hypothetical protein [Capnocytophaga canis]|uniref:hypothetical protein n=1 Tax=Capnocytophaga canis TaxID=1848903 RepID=UPI0037D513FD
MSTTTRTTEEIKEFYQKYQIDSEKGLTHTDVYAFNNQVEQGINKINQILEDLGIESRMQKLNKNDVLKDVVYPIKEAGIEKKFKESLNAFLENTMTLREAPQKAQKEVQAHEEAPKYTISQINEFYANHDFNKYNGLSHTDVYAFLHQYGNQEASKKLNEIATELLGKKVELKPYFKKEEVLKDVIYPLKKIGKETQMKDTLKKVLQQHKEELDKKRENSISMDDLDVILSNENAKELLYDAGAKKKDIDMLDLKSGIDLQAPEFVEKKKAFQEKISQEVADNLKDIIAKQEKTKQLKR